MRVKPYLDNKGWRRASVEEPYEVLGSFLEQDLQNSVPACKLFLEAIDAVKSGLIEDWQGTGNAHTVTLTRDKATIENEFAEPFIACELPIDEFRDAVMEWMTFIEEEAASS